MGQTTDQIETHIENKREDLGANLRELEGKVKSVTDWRHQFQTNPMTMIGVAFGGGVLLASMVGSRKRRPYRAASSSEFHAPGSASPAGFGQQKQRALETWDDIKGALIGVAATQFKTLLGEIVPGFQEQIHKTENDKSPYAPLTAASEPKRVD